jgi:predicted metal-binding membrane protein
MYRNPLGSADVQRNLILVLLLAAAAACWIALLMAGRGGEPDMVMASPTMGLGAPLFLAVWVVMMVAMMFPPAAPMILTFHQVQSAKRLRGGTFVPTWLFVAGYLVLWSLAGIIAYLAAVAAERVAARVGLSAATAARIGGALLILAGLYQLTPLKNTCLAKCRSPLGFIVTSWRDGALGAVRMGLVHGAYCLGCCWLLFVILFPLGMMNVAAMLVIALVVFAEKVLAWRRTAVYATAAVLALYGAVVIAVPRVLPTFVAPGAGMTTPASPATNMPGMNMPGMNIPGMNMPARPGVAPPPGNAAPPATR